MSKPRDKREKELLRRPLDRIIDLCHPLPTRLMTGFFILKRMHDQSQEVKRSRRNSQHGLIRDQDSGRERGEGARPPEDR